MRICSVEGCGKKFYCRGMCRGHYQSAVRSCDIHTKRWKRGRTIKERFLEKVRKPRNPKDCWWWTGGRNKKGYGRITIGPNWHPVMAHRVSYEIYNGEIPDGLRVRHTCDNTSCVNPAHLETGTNADNSRDMVSRGRSAAGTKNAHAKVTEMDVSQMRIAYSKTDVSQADLCRKYKLAAGTVHHILKGITWRHVHPKLATPPIRKWIVPPLTAATASA